MFFEPGLILAQHSMAGSEYEEALSWELGWESGASSATDQGQIPQPLSASIPQPWHDPCLSPKAVESTPANCPEILA